MDRVSGQSEARAGVEIVALARAWIGTPYVHQASRIGAGADCLGLIRGVWRTLYGREPEEVPPYTCDWSEPERVERLIEAAARHLDMVAVTEVRAGDVLAFRMISHGVAKHLGVLAVSEGGIQTLLHAYSGHGVVESPLTPAWCRRIAAAFRFPLRRQ